MRQECDVLYETYLFIGNQSKDNLHWLTMQIVLISGIKFGDYIEEWFYMAFFTSANFYWYVHFVANICYVLCRNIHWIIVVLYEACGCIYILIET